MRSSPAARSACGLTLAALIVLSMLGGVVPKARAEAHASSVGAGVAVGAAAFLGFSLLTILPSEIGVDIGFVERSAVPRLHLAWAYQLPICWLSRVPCTEDEPLMRHRIVASGIVSVGSQRDPQTGRSVLATGAFRVGYRYRFAHERRVLAPYIGAGSTVDLWPVVRPSISIEAGLHFGQDGFIRPGVMVGLVGDAYFAREPYLRVLLVAGWTAL